MVFSGSCFDTGDKNGMSSDIYWNIWNPSSRPGQAHKERIPRAEHPEEHSPTDGYVL